MAEQASGISDEPSDSPLAVGWRFWLSWVLASTVGWGVGGPVGVALGSFGEPRGFATSQSVPSIIMAGYLGVAVGGILVGVLQWLVLRRQVARAGWWVLASTVGWVVGMPVGGVLGWAALGAMYGVITGSQLLWLLRHRRAPHGRPTLGT